MRGRQADVLGARHEALPHSHGHGQRRQQGLNVSLALIAEAKDSPADRCERFLKQEHLPLCMGGGGYDNNAGTCAAKWVASVAGTLHKVMEFVPSLAGIDVLKSELPFFVEFRTEELAATACAFTGIPLLGRPIKTGRPSGTEGIMPQPLDVLPLKDAGMYKPFRFQYDFVIFA